MSGCLESAADRVYSVSMPLARAAPRGPSISMTRLSTHVWTRRLRLARIASTMGGLSAICLAASSRNLKAHATHSSCLRGGSGGTKAYCLQGRGMARTHLQGKLVSFGKPVPLPHNPLIAPGSAPGSTWLVPRRRIDSWPGLHKFEASLAYGIRRAMPYAGRSRLQSPLL